jgi:hypothetical protein
MVQSKPLRPEWLPAVALSSLLALAILIWSPPVGDLAAQVFRTELFQQAGLAIWNGSWYGGHYTLTYSLLFPPLAALLGPQVVGMLAVVSSSYLFDRLVRDRWGTEARWATLWFAAGVVTLMADGQLTFALGVAFALAALRCLQRGRGPLAIAAAAACPLASPVAAASTAPRSPPAGWPWPSPWSRTSPSPKPANSPSPSPPTSRSHSGAPAPSSSPRGCGGRSGSSGECSPATCSPRP